MFECMCFIKLFRGAEACKHIKCNIKPRVEIMTKWLQNSPGKLEREISRRTRQLPRKCLPGNRMTITQMKRLFDDVSEQVLAFD
jgi:hypothetical protein